MGRKLTLAVAWKSDGPVNEEKAAARLGDGLLV
jgi:hypothetical protein